MKNIPVMFCFDKNYVIQASVAFYSLMKYANKEYNYLFYILHSDISASQEKLLNETVKEFSNCQLEFINMGNRLSDFWDNNYGGGHFSKEVMYKLLTASIFPKIDKLIVSDVDVVFLDDISASYFEIDDTDDCYIAGVKPIGKIASYLQNYKPAWTDEEISKLGNICGGYLVMNLKKIREDKMEDVFMKSLKENGHRLNQMEQDIFNITCVNKIKNLHLKYVACSYMWDYYKTKEDMETDINYSKKEIQEAMDKPVQLHYATSIKPWKNVDCTKSEVWFEYLVKTPFLREFLEKLPNMIVTNNQVVVQKKDSKIISKVKRVINEPTLFLKKDTYRRIKTKNKTLIIFDDTFPSEISAFRYEEYMQYLRNFKNVYIATNGQNFNLLEPNELFETKIKMFEARYPEFAGRVLNMKKKNREESIQKIAEMKNSVAIVSFLNNMINEEHDNFSVIEKNNIPFILTLYPGGGFILDNQESDAKLQKVMQSKNFEKVIVTQNITKEYLLKKDFCKENKIEFIYGLVTPKKMLTNTKAKKYYSNDKENLDIIFVAHKYVANGTDKGYDLFVESAKKLLKKHKNINFHVVGNFSEQDIDISKIKNSFKFHGILTTDKLKELYHKMDIILSPTRPYVLSKGSFDGFPTGASTEAMISKVLLITTDELNQNHNFIDKEELIIVKPEVDIIVSEIEKLYKTPLNIKKIALAGSKKASKVYSIQKQIEPRIKIINKVLNSKYNGR